MTKISDERLAEMLAYTPTHADNKADRVFYRELRLIIRELQQLRAHNSDSAEPVAWRAKNSGHGALVSQVKQNLISNADDLYGKGHWELQPLYLASPPAKEVRADIIAQTIWNEHLFHADALVYDDKMITPDMAMAERLADLIVRALTNRTPDDEGGNG